MKNKTKKKTTDQCALHGESECSFTKSFSVVCVCTFRYVLGHNVFFYCKSLPKTLNIIFLLESIRVKDLDSL